MHVLPFIITDWFNMYPLAFSHSSHVIKDFLFVERFCSRDLVGFYECKQWCCFSYCHSLLCSLFLLSQLYCSVYGLIKSSFVWPRCPHWSRKGRRWWDRLDAPSSPASPTSAFLQVSKAEQISQFQLPQLLICVITPLRVSLKFQ